MECEDPSLSKYVFQDSSQCYISLRVSGWGIIVPRELQEKAQRKLVTCEVQWNRAGEMQRVDLHS